VTRQRSKTSDLVPIWPRDPRESAAGDGRARVIEAAVSLASTPPTRMAHRLLTQLFVRKGEMTMRNSIDAGATKSDAIKSPGCPVNYPDCGTTKTEEPKKGSAKPLRESTGRQRSTR
jgi:hypothetical protein